MHLLLTLSLALPAGALALVIARLYAKGVSHEHSAVMTAVMAAAMIAGLMAGLIAGLLSPADLWPPTVVGVATGLVVSLIAGLPSGSMVMIEGLMSGLMGGTMGAMASWMMTTRGAPLLISGSVISLVVAWLSWRMLVPTGGHGGHDGMAHKPQAMWPLALAAVVTLVVGVGAWAPLSRLPAPQAHQHGAVPSTVILARDLAFSPAMITLEYGRSVQLTLLNSGSQEHDLTVADPEFAGKAKTGEGLHIHTRAGESGSLLVTPLKRGEFKAYCSIPGHRDAGMVMLIVVR